MDRESDTDMESSRVIESGRDMECRMDMDSEMDMESEVDFECEEESHMQDHTKMHLAVTHYNNELFDKDDLDEDEVGGDFSSSLDTDSFCESPVIPCRQPENILQVEQIRVLAARRRRERSLSGNLVASNDFVLPRSRLCSSTQATGLLPGTAQDGCAASAAGRGEPVGASSVAPKLDKTKFTPLLPDSLRSQHTKTLQPSQPGQTRFENAAFEDDCVMSEGAKELERMLLEQGITPYYDPDKHVDTTACSVKMPSTAISDLRIFLIRPGPKDRGVIQCHIRREVHANWTSPRYKLHLSEGDRFLLAARKKQNTRCSNYVVSLDEDEISNRTGNYFGKVRSNFLGTEFWFYDKGLRPSPDNEFLYQFQISARVELGAVSYQHNVLGMRGPRKMVAIIPTVDDEGRPYVFPPKQNGSHVILEKYNMGEDIEKMIIMHNKAPRWNPEIGAYCLSFNGRVTRASVKNFQLVTESNKEHVILQFGKVGRNFFTMDYQHPMSALQAFMICLSSLDNKLACE